MASPARRRSSASTGEGVMRFITNVLASIVDGHLPEDGRAIAFGGNLHLSPLAGRGRRALARRVRGPLRESEPVERPPHPTPLPASGEREPKRRAKRDCPAVERPTPDRL